MQTVTVAYGDGIGPEIMEAVLYILKESKAPIKIDSIEIGEKLYKRNYTSGISEEAWNTISRNNILLKAPITTPLGGGYKSLNVTLRKALGLFANIRPIMSYHPFIKTMHPKLDMIIVRENEEDLYAGIEYRHTHNCYESLKLITETGCERIIRYAFEYAKKNNKKLVSAFSKDNIMKFSDGIFHKTFEKIAKEYPDLNTNHYLMDIGTAKIAAKPEIFEVIVTSNLYGDIISDVAAEISGSVGMAGSANIGHDYAMFEAVHGSAPDIEGKNIANPSGLLNAATMMLVHMGLADYANLIENAWKKTIEDGIHTADIYNDQSVAKVSTSDFAKEVVSRLKMEPEKITKAIYINSSSNINQQLDKVNIDSSAVKTLIGVDIFFDLKDTNASLIAEKITKLDLMGLELKTISTKGLKLWPHMQDNFNILSDHWCCRFMKKNDIIVSHEEISNLLNIFYKEGLDFVQTCNLYKFDDKLGFSLAQGE